MDLQVTQYNVVEPKTVFLLSVWNGKEISTFSLKPEGIKPNTNAVRRFTEMLDRVIRLKQNILEDYASDKCWFFLAALALTTLAS